MKKIINCEDSDISYLWEELQEGVFSFSIIPVLEDINESVLDLIKETSEKYPKGTFFENLGILRESSGKFRINLNTQIVTTIEGYSICSSKKWASIVVPKFKIGDSVEVIREKCTVTIVAIEIISNLLGYKISSGVWVPEHCLRVPGLEFSNIKFGEYITFESNSRTWVMKFSYMISEILYNEGAIVKRTTPTFLEGGSWGTVANVENLRYSTMDEIALFDKYLTLHNIKTLEKEVKRLKKLL